MLPEIAMHYILSTLLSEGKCYALDNKICYYADLDLIPSGLITELDDLVNMLQEFVKKYNPDVKVRIIGTRLQLEKEVNVSDRDLKNREYFHIFEDVLKKIFIVLLDNLRLVDDSEKDFCKSTVDKIIRFFGG